MSIVTPLYGHESFETAYLVDDYPYGRTLRCKIWFWIEFKQSMGYRFCSRTENPKNGRLNAPKNSTYHLVAANMYLDEKKHVTYSALSEYDGPERVLEFVKAFPLYRDRQRLTEWCKRKVAFCKAVLDSNTSPYKINGKVVPLPESEAENYTKEMRLWWRSFNLLQQKPEDENLP